MASSSSSIPSQKYEVFLSFRGEDTRYSFVSHLHTALNQKGIVTFFDEQDLEKGQSISPELLKSIKESKFAIIVFSKNYASSTWCLDELVKIMECRSKYSQTVIPIFYDVDPSDVRKQNNSFSESFAKHEVHFKDNMGKVQIWKENLREAASISGHDLSQRNVTEASCINKIVDHIFSELSRKASTKGLVGMENHLKKLKSLLCLPNLFACLQGTREVEGLVLRDPDRVKLKLNEGVFRNMNRLRLLEVYWEVTYVISPNYLRSSLWWLYGWKYQANFSLNYLPNSLRWIYWHKYPSKSLPVNFTPINLVSIDLSYSPTLQTFPNISDMSNLETLILSNCEKLLDVHPSVGVHKKLSHLDLSWSDNIKKIPRTMQMNSLETLCLSGYRLQSLPEFHNNMTSLKTIRLDNMGIKDLPWSLGRLTNLQEIDLEFCVKLRALPNSLCGLKNLESVKLRWSSNLKSFSKNPDDQNLRCFNTKPSSKGKREDNQDISKILTNFLSLPSLRTFYMMGCNVSELILPQTNGCLGSLEELDLSCNNFVSLPESINLFSSLGYLYLRYCSNLEEVTELPPRIKKLYLLGCTSLTRIPNLVDLLKKYENLELFSLLYCEKPVQKQDQFGKCNPHTNSGHSEPQFLLGLLDWESAATNILCNRKEALQVNFPCNYLFNWLHKSTGPQATVILSPSSFYNDKLKGLVICAISNTVDFQVVTGDGLVTIISSPKSSNWYHEHTIFFYIPIGKITYDIDRNEKKDYCLLKVTNDNYCPSTDRVEKTTWGIALVYDTGIGMDLSDLTVTNSPINLNENPTFKVCVAPRIQI